MIKNVDFVSIPVNDQPRALDFYVNKLGFSVFTDKPFNDQQRWIELKIADAQTRVVLFTAEEHKNRVGSFLNATLSCDDVQKTYEELQARGVEFVSPPRTEPWGTMAIFKDSEGNQILLSAK